MELDVARESRDVRGATGINAELRQSQRRGTHTVLRFTSQQNATLLEIIDPRQLPNTGDESMTRIRRMRVAIGQNNEWISLLSGSEPGSLRVIPEHGEEFEFSDNRSEPLEAQISKLLLERAAVTTD